MALARSPWAFVLALTWLWAPGLREAAAQAALPPEIGLNWQAQVDGLSFGYEFPLACVAVDAPAGEDLWCVSGGRVASPYFIELRSSQTGAVLWRYESPYKVGTRLVAALDGSAIYALGYDESELPFRRARLVALDAADGSPLWSTYLTSWSGTALVREPSDLVLSADGQRLFACGSETELSGTPVGWGTIGCARVSDGQLEWFQRRGPGDQASFGFEVLAFEPAAGLAGGGRIHVAGGNGASQGGLLWSESFEAANGYTQWQRSFAAGAALSLASGAAGLVLIGCARGSGNASLLALSSNSGQSQWTANLDEEVLDLALVQAVGSQLWRVLTAGVVDGVGIEAKNQLHTSCFQALDGALLWSQPFATPWGSPGSIDTEGLERQELLLADGGANRVVVGAGRGSYAGPEDFQLSSYDLVSGLPGWSQAIDVSPAQVGQGLRAVALSPDGQGILALGDDAGPIDLQGLRMQSFLAQNGQSDWVVTWNQGSSSANPPMDLIEDLASGSVFLLTRLNLGVYQVVALDRDSGAQRWSKQVIFPGSISPQLLPRLALSWQGDTLVMYLPGLDLTEVLAFDAVTGNELWQRFTEAAGPIGQPGRVLVTARDSDFLYLAIGGGPAVAGLRLLCWSLLDGSTVWEQDFASPGFDDSVVGIALDSSGQRLVAAATRTHALSGPNSADMFLVGLDADSGQLLGSAIFGDSNVSEQAHALALTPDGKRVAILGQRGGPAGDLIAAEFELTGALRWQQSLGGTAGGLRPEHALYSAQGVTLIIAATANPEGLLFGQTQALLLGWHGPTGVPLWQTAYGVQGGDHCSDLRLGKDGLTVYSSGTLGLGLGNGARGFVAAHDALDGAPLWQAEIDSQTPTSGFFLDDAGQSLWVSEDRRSLFCAAGLWDSQKLTDSLVLRLRLAELLVDPDALSLAAGGLQGLRLRASPELANDAYIVLGSASGVAGGMVLDGFELPLVIDAYTQFTLANAGGPQLQGSVGLLDALGRAQASVRLPAGLSPGLAGLVLQHAWLSIDLFGTWGVSWISNPAPLVLVP
jgi:outer membrane protein assembly factor BamB